MICSYYPKEIKERLRRIPLEWGILSIVDLSYYLPKVYW
jgi:hypothetical protein